MKPHRILVYLENYQQNFNFVAENIYKGLYNIQAKRRLEVYSMAKMPQNLGAR